MQEIEKAISRAIESLPGDRRDRRPVKIRKKNEKWRHDADYIRYVESGESAAVFVVRDIVQSLSTSGKWIDIISMDCYNEEPDGKAFNWIVCELFPRKIQPEYSEDAAHNKYITWQTATKDIFQQRSEGYNGPKYLILCTLRNKNKGKTINFVLFRIFKAFVGPGDATRLRSEAPKEFESESFTEPMKPDWEYKIKFLRKLSDSQAEYIKSHEAEIRSKIHSGVKITLEIMGIK